MSTRESAAQNQCFRFSNLHGYHHGWLAWWASLVLIVTSWAWTSAPTPRAAAQTTVCASDAATGTVFRDYNSSGTRDGREPGIEGILVTAYDSSGTAVACTTTANGTYGLGTLGAYPVRLEFSLPADGSLNFLRAGVAGANSHTSVMFLDEPGSNVDIGFSRPADFCGTSPAPSLATSCFVYGEQNDNPDGVYNDRTTVFTFGNIAGSAALTDAQQVRTPAPGALAVAKQVGAVWGLAWNPRDQTLYAAAFMKRHSGFGPYGPGAIYQITSAGSSLFYTFGALAGSDPHPQPGQTCLSPGHNANNNNSNCWINDSASFDQVGKVGFGGLALSETFDTLYTVSLANRTLLTIPIAEPAAFTATPLPIPASCPAVDVRPFSVSIHDGSVYVGAVCSGESTQNRTNLRAYVFAFTNGAFAATPVLDFPLTYARGAFSLQWQYWLNRTTFNKNELLQGSGRWAQPWLTDIVFDHNDMIIGVRDRNGDLFGTAAGGPDPFDPQNYSAQGRGDVVRACAKNGGWELEANGGCDGVTTGGAGNAQGPGGGEYYYQDEQLSPANAETSLGALAQVAGLPEVVSASFNPIEGANAVGDGGIKWYSNSTGRTTRGYLVFDASSDPALFQMANGLGDVEALCPGAPLEIGERVWRDADGDGLQDPDEPGLDGVSVELYRDGQLMGTTVTTSGGHYFFNTSNVIQNGAAGIIAGLCGPNGNAVYEIRIPNSSGANQQAALANLTLSPASESSGRLAEVRDSNGTPSGVDTIYAIPCADLRNPGDNNHTYDFGFTPAKHPYTEYIPLVAVVMQE